MVRNWESAGSCWFQYRHTDAQRFGCIQQNVEILELFCVSGHCASHNAGVPGGRRKCRHNDPHNVVCPGFEKLRLGVAVRGSIYFHAGIYRCCSHHLHNEDQYAPSQIAYLQCSRLSSGTTRIGPAGHFWILSAVQVRSFLGSLQGKIQEIFLGNSLN